MEKAQSDLTVGGSTNQTEENEQKQGCKMKKLVDINVSPLNNSEASFDQKFKTEEVKVAPARFQFKENKVFTAFLQTANVS